MRILFWNQCYAPHIGGVEIFTARLAAGLIANGHEPFVVTGRHAPDLPERETIEGVAVHRFSFLEGLAGKDADPRTQFQRSARLIAAVGALKRRIRPDIVHVNLSDASPFFHLRTRAAHACPTVLTFQAALTGPVSARGLTASILSASDRLVAVSHAAAANVARHAGVSIDAIQVIAPGVPTADFGDGPATFAPSSPMAVFIGRLVPEKGADMAIEAVARLGGAIGLRIIGDGPDRSRLEALAASRGGEGMIRFEGPVSDEERRRLLGEGFAMLVPSRHEELFGMVAVEGGLSALPVVGSRIGGLREIVEHGRTGLLCPPGDVAALAAALARLLADPAAARAMGRAGRERALASYTIDHTVAAYQALYAECASCGDGPADCLAAGL